MKKRLILLLSSLLMLCSLQVNAEDAGISVVVDGKALSFPTQKPAMKDDSVMIPFRALFEALGAYVDWVPETGTIVGSKDLKIIQLKPEQAIAQINGEAQELSAPVSIYDGTTMIPLRSVSELLSAKVEWNGETRTVSITTPQVGDHKINAEYLFRDYRDEAGHLLMRVAAGYPVMEYDAAAMNEIFKKDAEAFMQQSLENLSVTAKELFQKAEKPESFVPLYVIKNFEITYDRFGMLSYVDRAEELVNGAFYMDTRNYLLEQRTPFEADRIVNLSAEEKETLLPYTFYLYEDHLLFVLNSEYISYSQMFNLPPALTVAEENYKIDLTTGEALAWEPYPDAMSLEPRDGEQYTEYTTPHTMLGELSFTLHQLRDQTKHVPYRYRIYDETIAEIAYVRNGYAKVILRAAEGSYSIDGEAGIKVMEKDYKGSHINVYRTDSGVYALFRTETEAPVSYYLSLDDKTAQNELLWICYDILDQL